MKANTKYTAIEILTEAGVEHPEDKIGAVRVRIGGLPVNTPDHVINVSAETTELNIIVGTDELTVPVDEGEEEREISEGARTALDVEGQAQEEHTHVTTEETPEE